MISTAIVTAGPLVADTRQSQVVEAFVSLATRMARGDDVLELVTQLTTDCARLLNVASAGLLLADRKGMLHLLAASSQRTHDVETFQLQRDEGPCLDCYTTGAPVNCDDLSEQSARWPQFAATAMEAGFRSVHAMPLRVGTITIGAIGLFSTSAGSLEDEDRRLGQALADVASVSIVSDRAASDKETVNKQLQRALESRIAVEQAKGLLAQLGDMDMNEAFERIRRYCRDRQERLSDVARALSTRQLPPEHVLQHANAKKT